MNEILNLELSLMFFVYVFHISLSGKCGASGYSGETNMRIVGGYNAPAHYWPWMALLQMNFKTKNGRIQRDRCGGSIISNQWILTAAHCFDEDNEDKFIGAKVTLGEHDTNVIEGTEVFLKSSKHIVHEKYDNELFKNDIALIKLNETLDFKNKHKHLKPICLPLRAQTDEETCQVSGWGHLKNAGRAAQILQTVHLPILSDRYCLKTWGKDQYLPKYHICAGYSKGGKDSCQGDSGGPLACRQPSKTWAQYGLVSFGEECAKKEKPGVYTKIINYVDWIKKNTGTI